MPDVTGLRVVALKVAAMDHLFRPVLEFKHQMPEPHGVGFDDFFCILTPPKIPDVPLPRLCPSFAVTVAIAVCLGLLANPNPGSYQDNPISPYFSRMMTDFVFVRTCGYGSLDPAMLFGQGFSGRLY
jgi:hypothetical protein